MNNLDIIKANLLKKEESLQKYATKSKDAIRLHAKEEDIRPAFFHDVDTIIHSNPYSRYIDKTQVFSFLDNDHISKRVLHVQLVSKIARTIGRCLNLNEDLIEAIALGHDIGHTPIGHVGESILNKISLKELNIPFSHNVQSARTFMNLTKTNLSVQVLDGFLCHNGELLNNVYEPKKKTLEDFLYDYEHASKSLEYSKELVPMTLEGCVVRISDIIAYIGRDIEDAIRLGKLKRDELPTEITEVLGNTNREIVNNVILDIVNNSYGKNAVIMSKKVFDALNLLKNFNYKKIYNKANTEADLAYYETGMNNLFYNLLKDLETNKKESIIYKEFLNGISEDYIANTENKEIVIDFIAGMTDDYFVKMVDSVNKKILTE